VGHCHGDAAVWHSVFAIAKPYDGFACRERANVLLDRRGIGLRNVTSRLSTLQVDRSGSLTMTSDKREPEAINVPFYSSRVRIGMGFIGQRPARSPWPSQ